MSGLLLSGAAFTDGLTIVHTGQAVPSAPHVAMTVSMLRDAAADNPGPDPTRTAAAVERAQVIADNFARLGDHIILGTDAGAVGDFFGYADHLELELSGLTAM